MDGVPAATAVVRLEETAAGVPVAPQLAHLEEMAAGVPAAPLLVHLGEMADGALAAPLELVAMVDGDQAAPQAQPPMATTITEAALRATHTQKLPRAAIQVLLVPLRPEDIAPPYLEPLRAIPQAIPPPLRHADQPVHRSALRSHRATMLKTVAAGAEENPLMTILTILSRLARPSAIS